LTDSDHDLPVAPKRLLQQARPVRPDAVWVADITDVETGEGFSMWPEFWTVAAAAASAGRWATR
jgi:hypothetical protein